MKKSLQTIAAIMAINSLEKVLPKDEKKAKAYNFLLMTASIFFNPQSLNIEPLFSILKHRTGLKTKQIKKEI